MIDSIHKLSIFYIPSLLKLVKHVDYITQIFFFFCIPVLKEFKTIRWPGKQGPRETHVPSNHASHGDSSISLGPPETG